MKIKDNVFNVKGKQTPILAVYISDLYCSLTKPVITVFIRLLLSHTLSDHEIFDKEK